MSNEVTKSPVEVTSLALQTGICILCREAVTTHIGENGEWLGCSGQEQPHPLRRTTDRVLFIPVVAVGPPAGIAERRREKTGRRRRGTFKEAADRKAAARKHARSKEVMETTSKVERRGRIPGVYVSGKKEPTKLTESIKAVYHQVTSHKRGVSMKAIADKLEMPTGTVGWAIQKLIKQGAVKYEPAQTAQAA